MRSYFFIISIVILLFDFIVYVYNGSFLVIIITGIMAILNLIAAIFYKWIVDVYDEADNLDSL